MNWIEEAKKRLDATIHAQRTIAKEGGNVRPDPRGFELDTADTSPRQTGKIVGNRGRITAGDINKPHRAKARTVVTAVGEVVAISGEEDDPVTIYDANRMLGRNQAGEVRRALGRSTRRRKKKLQG